MNSLAVLLKNIYISGERFSCLLVKTVGCFLKWYIIWSGKSSHFFVFTEFVLVPACEL